MAVEVDGSLMLESKRIYLRRFEEKDAPLLLKWGQNTRYHDMAGFEQIQNMDQAVKSVHQYMARPESYVICLRDGDKAIGLIELYERGMDEQSGLLKTKEIGFLLDQAFEGRGYMTEAVRLILTYAFKKKRQTEVWAGTFADNEKSQKLLQKLGFHYVYTVDYSQVSVLFSFKEKYYLLKKEEWLKIDENTKS